MKYIIPLITIAFTTAVYADDLGLTTNITDIAAQDGRNIGQIYKEDILRDPDRVYTLLKIDRDRDGKYDHIQEMFYYSNECILSISHSGDNGIVFSGKSGTDAYYADTNNDGKRDSIMLISADMVVRDKYQLGADDEYFRPVDDTALETIQKASSRVAPLATTVLESISPENE